MRKVDIMSEKGTSLARYVEHFGLEILNRGDTYDTDLIEVVNLNRPDLPILGSAFSYLRGYAPNLAAGMVGGGHVAMAGFGRMAFANPDFPNQLKEKGKIDKVCLTCGNCAVLLRSGRCSGCVIHDREVYKL